MNALPNPTGCCQDECSTTTATAIPGPQGPSGADGTNGQDGHNAFTYVGAAFTQPAIGANVTIEVLDPYWMMDGMYIFIAFGGYYEVVNNAFDGIHVTLQNLGYAENSAPGTVIPFMADVVTSGPRGATGPAGTTVDINDISPTTAEGDILVDDGGGGGAASVVRKGIGTNKYVLHVNTGVAPHIAYQVVDLTGAATALAGALALANGGTGQTTAQLAINALLNAAGSSLGDLAYFNGTNWIRFPRGTGYHLLRNNAAGASIEYALLSPPSVDWAGVNQATASGNYTVDWTTGLAFSFDTTGGNNIVLDFSNPTSGQDIVIAVTLEGADTLTWTPAIKWKGSAEPTPSGLGATDIFWFQYINGTYYGAAALNFG